MGLPTVWSLGSSPATNTTSRVDGTSQNATLHGILGRRATGPDLGGVLTDLEALWLEIAGKFEVIPWLYPPFPSNLSALATL